MTLYKTIADKDSFRRRTLETSKLVLSDMQRYVKVLNLRKEKILQISNLKGQLKELTLLVQKLDGLLPEKSIKREKKPVTAKKQLAPAQSKQLAVKKGPSEDYEMIKATLAEIDEKLKNL
ncbi:MAG: hypothetical protein H6502_01135 [Candidatus Woesearchaeota archaeon]|nr:MAG: hypothetical protein H6502_01135 [Candidatus Woesearchaeota archaeon]